MKKTIKNLEAKVIKNVKAIKGGDGPKPRGTWESIQPDYENDEILEGVVNP